MGITVRSIKNSSPLNEVVIGIGEFGLLATATAGHFISGGETRSAGNVVPHDCHLNRVLIAVEITAAIATATNYYTLTVKNATKSATVINHIIPVISTCAGTAMLSATADSLITAGSLLKASVVATGSGTITNLYMVGLGRYDSQVR